MLTEKIGRAAATPSFARGAAILLGSCLIGSPAGAISLEEYFLELTERERGAYVVGFMDLFANDAGREEDYRACVGDAGAVRLHQELTSSVRDDPRMLTYDAAPWLLYTAARLCKGAAAERPTVAEEPPVEQARSGVDALPAPVPEAPATVDPTQEGDPTQEDDSAGDGDPVAGGADIPYVVIGGGVVAGVVFGLIMGRVVGRRDRRVGVRSPPAHG